MFGENLADDPKDPDWRSYSVGNGNPHAKYFFPLTN
jgi:hypothetical protein